MSVDDENIDTFEDAVEIEQVLNNDQETTEKQKEL